MNVRLQPLVRGKVAALGAAGQAWHDALPSVLADLAERWDVQLGRGLPGGSASYVCAARTHDGADRVLKVVLPAADLGDQQAEAPVLAAAGGAGYAVLHAHDTERGALLLERLGPSLETGAPEVDIALDLLVDTLAAAWRVAPSVGRPAPDLAGRLWRTLERRDRDLGRPMPTAARRAAHAAADRLTDGDDPAAYVVTHGDPHPGNLLRATDGRGTGWAFVDPEGRLADPAYDVGVTLRDWCSRLEGPGASARLDRWTRRAAERAGLDAGRVVDWAYLERVSTGVYLLSLGADRLGRRFLECALALHPPDG